MARKSVITTEFHEHIANLPQWGDCMSELGRQFVRLGSMLLQERGGRAIRILPVALMILAVAVPCQAGMIGSPAPVGKSQQWVFGAGYFVTEASWENDEPSSGDVTIQRNQVYLESSFPETGFSEEGAIFLRLGMADIDDGKGFDDGYNLFGTFGIRDIWYGGGRRRSSLQIGTVGQLSYYMKSEKTVGTATAELKNNWEVGLAVIAQWPLMPGKVSVYGGPTLEYGTAKFSFENGGSSTSSTLKRKDLVGGTVGARVSLPLKGMGLDVEGQFSGKSSFGAFLSYSF